MLLGLTDQEGALGPAAARHPDALAAQRRERARIRGETSIRWGGRPLATVARRTRHP
ncbi:hypothetical protein [Streptomyces sp. NPDC058385]|uniref:hypothetical protein n=1 Tax=Streptomyces sp. NPDC058385 TaxID=3346473 RepID=UPI00365B9715